jgi:hypothetical protein
MLARVMNARNRIEVRRKLICICSQGLADKHALKLASSDPLSTTLREIRLNYMILHTYV